MRGGKEWLHAPATYELTSCMPLASFLRPRRCQGRSMHRRRRCAATSASLVGSVGELRARPPLPRRWAPLLALGHQQQRGVDPCITCQRTRIEFDAYRVIIDSWDPLWFKEKTIFYLFFWHALRQTRLVRVFPHQRPHPGNNNFFYKDRLVAGDWFLL